MVAIPTPVEALAAAVPAGVGEVAATVQAVFDAIAAALEAIGQSFVAMRVGAAGALVVAVFDVGAAAVQALVDAVAMAIHAVFDAVATVGGGRGAGQGEAEGQQGKRGKRGPVLHHDPPVGRHVPAGEGNAARHQRLTGRAPDSPIVMMAATRHGARRMVDGFAVAFIFVLAAIAGNVIVSRVPVILHTPLMSGSNFIHGIVLIGAIVVLGAAETPLEKVIGFAAVLLGAGNAAGGYVVTERMLDMFKSSRKPEAGK